MALSSKYIKNSCISTTTKNTNPINKWAKDLNRHFSKEDIQKALNFNSSFSKIEKPESEIDI